MHIVLFVLLEAYECKVLKITARLSSKKRHSKASYLKKTENVFCKWSTLDFERVFFLLTSFLVNVCYISHHTTGTIIHRIYKYVSSFISKTFPYRKLFYVYLS